MNLLETQTSCRRERHRGRSDCFRRLSGHRHSHNTQSQTPRSHHDCSYDKLVGHIGGFCWDGSSSLFYYIRQNHDLPYSAQSNCGRNFRDFLDPRFTPVIFLPHPVGMLRDLAVHTFVSSRYRGHWHLWVSDRALSAGPGCEPDVDCRFRRLHLFLRQTSADDFC